MSDEVNAEEIRNKLGLSVPQMCRLLGVSKSTFENWQYSGSSHRKIRGATRQLFHLLEWLHDEDMLDTVLEALGIERG